MIYSCLKTYNTAVKVSVKWKYLFSIKLGIHDEFFELILLLQLSGLAVMDGLCIYLGYHRLEHTKTNHKLPMVTLEIFTPYMYSCQIVFFVTLMYSVRQMKVYTALSEQDCSL